MHSLVCWITSYVVNALWEVALMGTAGWAASRFLARVGPQAQHGAWVVALWLGVLAPALPFCRALPGIAHFHGAMDGVVLVAIGGAVSGNVAQHGSIVLSDGLIRILFCSYLSAVVYFAARLVVSLYRSGWLLRGARPLRLSGESDAIWECCRKVFDIRDAELLMSTQLQGPAAVGLRRAAILIPPGFAEGCTPQDFRSAMGHECAHLRRSDYAKNLLYEAASVTIAFHPMTWLLKARIAQTREMICDAMTVEKLIDRRTYTESLLRLATRIATAPRTSTPHAIGIFDANILEKRIMLMKTNKRSLGAIARAGLIASGALLLGATLAVGNALSESVEAQSAAADLPYGHVYHPGKDVTNPVLTVAPNPEFPEAERRSTKTGFSVACVVGVIVDAGGMPQEVHVVRSAGKDFDAEALKVVRQYRFKPGMRQGKPVAVAINIEVNFKKY
jgi:TonB family protein